MSLHVKYFAIRILAILGVALAIYLLIEQIFHPSFQPCRINSTINCDAIISGAVAKTLGIPTPLYGLTGYILIFFAATFRKKKLLLSVASFGLLFCLWIAYRELFQLHVICPVCIGCQIIMITVFCLAFLINKEKPKKR
jgi:uncharacterized membrane protein